MKETEKKIEVYDADKKELIQINEEFIKKAFAMHQQVVIGAYAMANALKRIKDEKLYLGLNCSSFDEYIASNSLAINRRQAYKYVKIIEVFEKRTLPINVQSTALENDTEENVQPAALEGDAEENVQPAALFQKYGIEKLYKMALLDDDEFSELIDDGAFMVELEGANKKDFMTKLKEWQEERKKLQSFSSRLTEENKLLKDEKKELEKRLAEDDERVKNAEEIERLWGGPANLLKEKRAALERANEHLSLFQRYLTKCNIDVDDPENLQKELIDTIRMIDATQRSAEVNYGDVLLRQAEIEG